MTAKLNQLEHGFLPEGRIIGAREPMQVRELQPAPRCAQHREPRNAIHRMQQGVSQRAQVQQFLPFREVLNLHRAKWNPVLPQKPHDLRKMVAGADQDGDPVFTAGVARVPDLREMLLDDIEDNLRLFVLRCGQFSEGGAAIRRADDQGVDVQPVLRRTAGCTRRCARKGYGSRSRRCRLRTNQIEDTVERLGESGMGAEIDGKLHGTASIHTTRFWIEMLMI